MHQCLKYPNFLVQLHPLFRDEITSPCSLDSLSGFVHFADVFGLRSDKGHKVDDA